MTTKSRRRLVRRSIPKSPADGQQARGPTPRRAGNIDDAFFRYIVSGMRNAVLAITRERMLALINDEAYRIFGVTPRPTDLGGPIADVLHEHPEVGPVADTVFDTHLLPNRVALRRRPSGKGIAYPP